MPARSAHALIAFKESRMAHIGCVCGNDVRGNSIETIYRFVSDDLMNEYAESETFFRPSHLPGEKAEIWLCNECGRAIFFDDGGLYVTRYMRPAEPMGFSQWHEPTKAGVFFGDKVFFDAVSEHFSYESDAGRTLNYEFFYKEYAEGKPLLSPSVMQEKVFGNPDRKFPRWTRALLLDSFLAVFDDAGGISDAPSRLWLLSKEDMAALRHSGTSAE